jgi:hypothetical protein
VNGLILNWNAGACSTKSAAFDDARARSGARVKGEILGPRGRAAVSASGSGKPTQGEFDRSRCGIGRRAANEGLRRAAGWRAGSGHRRYNLLGQS